MLLKKCTKPFCGKIYNEKDEAFHDGYCDCGFELVEYDPMEEAAKEAAVAKEKAVEEEAAAAAESEVEQEETAAEDSETSEEEPALAEESGVSGEQDNDGDSSFQEDSLTDSEEAPSSVVLSHNINGEEESDDNNPESTATVAVNADSSNTEVTLSTVEPMEEEEAEAIDGPPYLILDDGTLVFPEDEEYAAVLQEMKEKEERLQVDPYEDYEGNRVVAFVDGEVFRTFPLEYDENIIGRESKGNRPDIDLTDIDPDRKISRRHALIYRYNQQYYIRNLSSKNSLYVNRELIPQNEEVPLEDGSTIVLSGEYGLIFYAASEADADE